MAAAGYMEKLQENADKKRSLLEEMLALTRAQTQTIHENGLKELNRLIAEKQLRIDAIHTLDEDFEVIFRQLKDKLKINHLDALAGMGLTGAAQLKGTVGGIMDVIREISVLEKQNSENADKVFHALRDEIRKIQCGRKVNAAYTAKISAVPSYFIDRKK